ncbi:MAG: hypothetical protein WCX64_01385 [Candidatus Micrarchaeia archaeon]|jgi:hypothetical protein
MEFSESKKKGREIKEKVGGTCVPHTLKINYFFLAFALAFFFAAMCGFTPFLEKLILALRHHIKNYTRIFGKIISGKIRFFAGFFYFFRQILFFSAKNGAGGMLPPKNQGTYFFFAFFFAAISLRLLFLRFIISPARRI